MIRLITLIAIGIFCFTACDTTEPVEDIKEDIVDEIVEIRNEFEGIKFDDPVHLDLLEELGICEMVSSDSNYYATCSPENFKIIAYKKDKDIRDAFILQVKAAIRFKGQDVPLPVRHIVVFERENGELIRLNGFRGDLIGMTDGDSGIKDLMVALYLTDDETLFHCLFKWNGGQYSFESIEGLDYGDGVRMLQPALKDSLSNDIYSSLMTSNLIF